MRALFIILILGSLWTAYACKKGGPWKFVYTNGHALAVQQDSLLDKLEKGDTLGEATIRELRINWWVRTAYRTAPGNLPIRQYCIIDIARGKPRYARRIKKMVDSLSILTVEHPYRTWAEGYSYWKYTNRALSMWVKKFNDEELRSISESIDSGFAYTAYMRTDGLYYPAPFGDLRDEPLDIKGQNLCRRITDLSENAKNQNVIRGVTDKKMWDEESGKIRYRILSMPVGLNNHCQKQSNEYDVTNGFVIGFEYYKGYDKKYDDREAEWTDIFDIRRLITIPFIW